MQGERREVECEGTGEREREGRVRCGKAGECTSLLLLVKLQRGNLYGGGNTARIGGALG